jgi:hypothetical protein
MAATIFYKYLLNNLLKTRALIGQKLKKPVFLYKFDRNTGNFHAGRVDCAGI